MSRQIEFFQTPEDELEFLQLVNSSGYSIVDVFGEIVSVEVANTSKALSLFIVFSNSHICISKSGYLDAIVSEVIQFSRGFEKDNQLQNSRLWFQTKYFDIKGRQTTKSKELLVMYDALEKWIKKEYVKSVCNHYYIGKKAYVKLKEDGIDYVAGPKHKVNFS